MNKEDVTLATTELKAKLLARSYAALVILGFVIFMYASAHIGHKIETYQMTALGRICGITLMLLGWLSALLLFRVQGWRYVINPLNVLFGRHDQLDEREVRDRQQIFVKSYTILALGVVLLMAYFIAFQRLVIIWPTSYAASSAIWFFKPVLWALYNIGFFAVALPSLLGAWSSGVQNSEEL